MSGIEQGMGANKIDKRIQALEGLVGSIEQPDQLQGILEKVQKGVQLFTGPEVTALREAGLDDEVLRELFPISFGNTQVEISDEPESGGQPFSPQE